jgi:hypothetical protein
MKSRRPAPLFAAAVSALFAVAVTATTIGVTSCSSVSNERIGIDAPPFSEQTFQPFGDYLIYRCGTLDCHGNSGRNFQIWGCDGQRLDADASPACTKFEDPGGSLTTIEEYQATYRSLVGLEPQVMSTVWAGCGGASGPDGGDAYPPPSTCHPELLTFVEKARGIEKHKGGQLICISPPCPPGVPVPDPTATPPRYDPQDVCIVTWLEGNVDVDACQTPQQKQYGTPAALDASTE